ncbi:hypothetical protein [Mycolicibacterium sphagni]|uniref:Uncharacterized protein n=1 Tax=Mycolicibacterium sphagni TaxID=1786 RepID=A0ABX2JMN7_9MYCO|nr:hypothetical protein [Mycolicibacterium sphagni]NTY58735.1 hypothetical protein [Mycolicibacterium sphagni]
MTDEPAFEYRPRPGFDFSWSMRTSGYGDEPGLEVLDTDWDLFDNLSEIEGTIENVEETEYPQHRPGVSIVRVSGGHGWREYEWSNGKTHRYEWELFTWDLRCPRCKHTDSPLYMVTDEVWASAGFDGKECFRCLEEAIGRQLVPADFDPTIPCNDPTQFQHGPELRQRMGHA